MTAKHLPHPGRPVHLVKERLFRVPVLSFVEGFRVLRGLSSTSVRKFVPPLNSSPNPLLLGKEGGFGASPSPRLFSPSLRKRGGRGVSFRGGGGRTSEQML